ncbi:hypothetical protein LTR97_003844 [Elasticomyces elasticus]|uniref:Uncharacterized protein n=1 Tax=Elasticomyces elasticus TaxID=574655 RepID=A0AAN7WD31_9PEZI|nr:hypothetical protein LTR97_003844 [Elasticomyces elasticus]
MAPTTFTTFDSLYAHLTTTYSYPVLASQSPNPHSKALSHSIASLSLHPTLESILHILNGDLSSAHFLCRHMQNEPAWEGMYIHGLLHRVEGDYRNAEAWYGNVAETECFQHGWGGEQGLEDAKAFIRRIEKLRKEKVGSLEELEAESKREVDALVEWCKQKFGTGKMEDASQAWVEPSEEHRKIASKMLCPRIMAPPVYTEAEWAAWFDTNLQDEEQGDAPLSGEMRSTLLPLRESTPLYEDRPVLSTERDISAGNPAYYDMMAAPPPRFRNEAELAKLAEYEAYIRAEAQRNAALWGEMRNTPQRPREKIVRREEQPVQSTEWNLAAGMFEYDAGTFPHGDMMAASPPWPRSEGSGGPMTMPPPQWQADFASARPQRPRRDMAHEYPLDFSPTMSPPPPPGMAIRHPPGEPPATFASTLPQRPEPGIARGYHSGVAPTMPQPPAFGMAGGQTPASFTEHSAFGQPGPYQDMPGDPSPDDWVFMGFSGNPRMMMEANAFAMLSPQDLASAPAAQAPRSRGPYAESHHPYQPHSGSPLQTDHQSGGGQSYFQGVRVMPNTEAPQPSPYAAPYGHIQPTQLPMDPQQMYHAPSISPVANTIPPQASVYAAPYIHRRRTQSHVDPQQMYQAPSIPPVTNNYNFGIMVQGNQRNSSRNNGMQLHAAPPSAAPLPANHIDNTAAKRSKSAGPSLKETNIYQWDPKCLKNPTKHPTNMCNEENSHKSAGVIHVDVSLFPSGIDIPDKDKAKKKKYRRKKNS